MWKSVTSRFVFFRIFHNSHHRHSNTLVGWSVWAAIVGTTWVFAFLIAEVIPFFSDMLSLMSSLFGTSAPLMVYGSYRYFFPRWMVRVRSPYIAEDVTHGLTSLIDVLVALPQIHLLGHGIPDFIPWPQEMGRATTLARDHIQLLSHLIRPLYPRCRNIRKSFFARSGAVSCYSLTPTGLDTVDHQQLQGRHSRKAVLMCEQCIVNHSVQ
jgi:hypothetical protein